MKPSETPPVKEGLQNGKKTKPRFLFFSLLCSDCPIRRLTKSVKTKVLQTNSGKNELCL